ncbi:hypothetical protein HELRODRAFT_189700 [Helobdella robusta]|uniref:Uncharacterized protein n=1 Tax=Helobdella robusta TaxID=6412 RepID=T1FR99_HELRO|nr:hypothetical protein HELRODRAFT_189700 [Helobdella robusta]ESN91485.1 hypothetical protein HELRODRAFT_189700 [Helobdella robusta]
MNNNKYNSTNNKNENSFTNSKNKTGYPTLFSSSMTSIGSSWNDPNRLEMVGDEEIMMDIYNGSTSNNNTHDNSTQNFFNGHADNKRTSINGHADNKRTSIHRPTGGSAGISNGEVNYDKVTNSNLKSTFFLTTPKPFSSEATKYSSITPIKNNFQLEHKSKKTLTKTKEQNSTTTTTAENKSSNNNQNENGVVHLSTRIISDDVPARSYGVDYLRSESVISYVNPTTQPSVVACSIASTQSTSNLQLVSDVTKNIVTSSNSTKVVETQISKTLNNFSSAVENNKTSLTDNFYITNYETDQTSFINPVLSRAATSKKYVAPLPPTSTSYQTTTSSSTNNSVTNGTTTITENSLPTTKPAPRFDFSAYEKGKLPNISKPSLLKSPTLNITTSNPLTTHSEAAVSTTSVMPPLINSYVQSTVFSENGLNRKDLSPSDENINNELTKFPRTPTSPLSPTFQNSAKLTTTTSTTILENKNNVYKDFSNTVLLLNDSFNNSNIIREEKSVLTGGFHIGLPTVFKKSPPNFNNTEVSPADQNEHFRPSVQNKQESSDGKSIQILNENSKNKKISTNTVNSFESNSKKKSFIRSYESKLSPTTYQQNSESVFVNKFDLSSNDQKLNVASKNKSEFLNPINKNSNINNEFKQPSTDIPPTTQIANISVQKENMNEFQIKKDDFLKTTAIDKVLLDSPDNQGNVSKHVSKINIPPIFNHTYNSNLNKKSLVNIPQNNFIRDKRFINHLENVIAKSATSSPNIRANFKNDNKNVSNNKPIFKFLVEGIDIPGNSENHTAHEQEDLSANNETTAKTRKEPKGFSYIKDKRSAEQLTKLAAEVTARKPHESVESLNLDKEVKSPGENDFMKEARKKLHAHLNGLKKFELHESLVGENDRSEFSKSVPNINDSGLDDNYVFSNRLTPFNKDDKMTDVNKQRGVHGNRRHKTESNIQTNNFNNLSNNDWHNVTPNGPHSIPHDTSRIFLRPHSNDMEQLKKLEKERNQTLKRKTVNLFKSSTTDTNNQYLAPINFSDLKVKNVQNYDSVDFSPRGTYEEINSNLMSSSSDFSKDEPSLSSGRYTKSKNSSTPSLKQSKIKQKAKMYNGNKKIIDESHTATGNRYPTYNTNTPTRQHASTRSTDHRTVYNDPGMLSPVLQAGARSDSTQPTNARLIEDAYNRSQPYDSRDAIEQNKTITRGRIKNSESDFDGNKRINVNNYLNANESSSEYSDDSFYNSNDIKNRHRDNFVSSSRHYGSETNLTTQNKFTTPGNIKIGIEKADRNKVSAVEVRNHDIPVKGFITVNKLKKPNSSSLTNIPSVVYGELTLLKNGIKSQHNRIRSRTLAAPHVTVGGPGVYSKSLHDQNQIFQFNSNYIKNSISLHDLTSGNSNKKLISDSYKTTTLNRFSSKIVSKKGKGMQGYDTVTRSLPSIEAASVDPELEKVGKLGNQYRIQLKLNAALPEKHGLTSGRQSRLTNVSYHEMPHLNQEKYRPASGLMYSSNFVEFDDGLNQTVNNLSLNYSSPVPPPLSFYHSPSYKNNQIDSLLSLQVSPQTNLLTTVNRGSENGENFAIKSITASNSTQQSHNPSKVEFQLELLPLPEASVETFAVPSTYPTGTTSRKTKSQAHDYNMTLNNTMRLEYEPPHEFFGEKHSLKNRTTPITPDDEYMHQNNMDPNAFPKIVRGSILIRNSLDKETSRRYLNALHNDRNKSKNNLFHAKYHQRRENPAYSSDFENMDNYLKNSKHLISSKDSDANDETFQEIPTIAQDWDEIDNRNIPVNREWYYDYLTDSKRKSENSNKRSGAWKLKSSKNNESSNYTDGETSNYNDSRHRTHGTQVETALNVDAVSEKVELSLSNGIVTIEVKVRCERLVPIRGTSDMFRKSAVVVTRKIEIDMTVTPERKSMYETAVALSKKQHGTQETSNKSSKCLRLSTKDTFELYCKLMEMADKIEGPEEGMLFGSVHIDKELEENKRLPYGATSAEILITDDNLLSPQSSMYHRARTRPS